MPWALPQAVFAADARAVFVAQRFAGQAALMGGLAWAEMAAAMADAEGLAVARMLPGAQQAGQQLAQDGLFGGRQRCRSPSPGIVDHGRQHGESRRGQAQPNAAAVDGISLADQPAALFQHFQALRDRAFGQAQIFGECLLGVAVAIGVAQIAQDRQLDGQQPGAYRRLALLVLHGAGEGGKQFGKCVGHDLMVATQNEVDK